LALPVARWFNWQLDHVYRIKLEIFGSPQELFHAAADKFCRLGSSASTITAGSP
jgi:hypothetical protein